MPKRPTLQRLLPISPRSPNLDCPAVIASAPGEDGIDFVSRFFAPALGIPEDPVTGASALHAHALLSKRLGKTRLEARQIFSTRRRAHLHAGRRTCDHRGRACFYLEERSQYRT